MSGEKITKLPTGAPARPEPLPQERDPGNKRERVLLTPDAARWLLEHNYDDNRRIRQQQVNRIARAIKAGRWGYNGNTIKCAFVDCEIVLLDGQHRGWAVVEAGVAVDTEIVYGVPLAAFLAANDRPGAVGPKVAVA